MADISCPLCGKPTPEDQDTCRHCRAVLKSTEPSAAPEGGEQLPDWLRDLQASEAALPAEQSPAEEALSLETELPDWLSRAAPTPGATPEAEAEAEPSAEPVSGDETPAWLEGLLGTSAEQSAPEEVIPDWLAGPGEPDRSSPAPSEETAAPLEQAKVPDWLAHLPQAPTEKPASYVPAFTFDEETPPEAQAGADDRLLSTLPDWVSQIAAELPETPAESEPELAPAELPGWLEAMRPLESASPTAPLEDLTSAEVVAAGPLIGLRGVLSAEPDAIRAHRPSAHALKLRVTDEQRTRMALLEELLAGEHKPKPLPQLPVVTPQYLFRLAIAAVLLIPILWVVIKESIIAPLPQAEEQPTVMQFDTEVRRLNEGDPVLLAVDYEAGFSGEMELAANVVLSRLAEQGPYLVMVSTNTTGPALSERLLSTLNDTLGTPYADATNLGFLPGGALGLAGLVQSPQQLLPYTLAGDDPWSRAPLNAVNSLADFGMVIVFANDADTARAWIEQTGPVLKANQIPLLLVVSAQAGPLLRPYVDTASSPVKAMLAGLPDNAAFENMTTRYSPGRHEIWDAFSLSLPIAALVILTGNLAGAVIAAIRISNSEARSSPTPRRKSGQTQERP
jgi:hypothetical protein